VGVGEVLVLVGMRVFHSGRKIGMRMGVVSIVMAMPVLMGLGVDELSVAASRVGLVRQRVRELSYARERVAAKELLDEARDARRERV